VSSPHVASTLVCVLDITREWECYSQGPRGSSKQLEQRVKSKVTQPLEKKKGKRRKGCDATPGFLLSSYPRNNESRIMSFFAFPSNRFPHPPDAGISCWSRRHVSARHGGLLLYQNQSAGRVCQNKVTVCSLRRIVASYRLLALAFLTDFFLLPLCPFLSCYCTRNERGGRRLISLDRFLFPKYNSLPYLTNLLSVICR
jgi:hypothetical protein